MNATPQNDLRHLFDGTHCLSKRQLRDYAASFASSASSMSLEEAYAVESHLNSCPLCSAAVDGMIAHFPESADVLATVDSGFLKEHFKNHSPQIHLNTVAPSAAVPITRRIPGGTRVIDLTTFRMVGIAAAIVLFVGSLWWFQSSDGGEDSYDAASPIAQIETSSAAATDGRASFQMPESERRLAQAIPVAPDREKAPSRAESENKKSTQQLLAEADAAVDNRESSGVPSVQDDRPVAVGGAEVAMSKAIPGAVAETDNAVRLSAAKKVEDVNPRARRNELLGSEVKQTSSRTVLTGSEIEKMSTRNTPPAAAPAPGANRNSSVEGLDIRSGRGENTVYVAEGNQHVANTGKALYRKGEYSAALKIFKQQMAAGSGGAREEATLYAARCHRALGQNAAAEKLLKNLADGKGSNARAARRELRDMDAGYEAEAGRRSSPATTTKGDDR